MVRPQLVEDDFTEVRDQMVPYDRPVPVAGALIDLEILEPGR